MVVYWGNIRWRLLPTLLVTLSACRLLVNEATVTTENNYKTRFKIQQPQTLFQGPKTFAWHCTFKAHLGLKGQQHQQRNQMACYRESKCLQSKPFPPQFMSVWKTLHINCSWCFSSKQEIWTRYEMSRRKQVLRNQSEETSLQPSLNLKIQNLKLTPAVPYGIGNNHWPFFKRRKSEPVNPVAVDLSGSRNHF